MLQRPRSLPSAPFTVLPSCSSRLRPRLAHARVRRCWSTPRVAHSRITFAYTSYGRLARCPSRTSPPRRTCGDLEVAGSVFRFGKRLALHSQASYRCFRVVAGSHFLRFARCLATVDLLTAPSQPRRRLASRGAALPTVASGGSATIQPRRIPPQRHRRGHPVAAIQPRRIPSNSSAAIQRHRRGHPVAAPLWRRLCDGGGSCRRFAHKPRRTDGRADRQTDRQTDFYYSIQ